jgi:hypothetical protein
MATEAARLNGNRFTGGTKKNPLDTNRPSHGRSWTKIGNGFSSVLGIGDWICRGRGMHILVILFENLGDLHQVLGEYVEKTRTQAIKRSPSG